ncbi:MAG: bisanhydrobacterioruberin hydratase [Halobacteriaceae archaeon]
MAEHRDVAGLVDGVVTGNRTTIAVVVPAVGAVILAASAAGLLPEWLAYNPVAILFGVAVMRLPLVGTLAPLLTRRGVAALVALTAYAYVVEYVGLTTGVPYGDFTYGLALGPTVAGVPVALPLLFIPLVLNAVFLAALIAPEARRSHRVGLAAAIVVAVDLVLDPAAVAVGFWTYAAPGPYYGVPLSNYGGWVIAAVVGVVLVEAGFPRDALRSRVRTTPYALDDFVSFTLLWGGLNLYFGYALPVLITGGLVVGLAAVDGFDFAAPVAARGKPP